MEEENSNESIETPVLPLYSVNVQGAVKHGESVMFTLEVKKAGSEDITVILREYEDFEWLHHNLVSGYNAGGAIIPPLPMKSLSDPKSAENLSKKQLGDQTRVLKGDQFDLDCKTIQLYLQHMLKHSLFGTDKNLAQFLDETEAPVRARLNKGLMTRLSSAIDNVRKAYVKDLDGDYVKERQFSIDFNRIAKELSSNYNKLLVSQWRLSSSYRTVVTELTSCTAERDDGLIRLNKILRLLSEGMEDEAASWELRTTREETGLGCYLEVMARYSEALKEMHNRRITNMVEFNNCEKTLEKVKPAKKPMAEEAFETAKSTFEKVSQQGKDEIQLFKQMRLKFSEETLSTHAEVQMKISQDFYTQLFHTRKALLEIQV